MSKPLIEKNEKVVVRMAPSPTGNLHVGTARTALFNYLFAKHYKGKFILRVEDTDVERSAKEFEKDILEGLKWLGIEWDGQVEYSSKRKDVYKKYLLQLIEEGKAFYCNHTKDELQKEKQGQIENREAPRHVCDHRNSNLKEGIIRFKNDHEGEISFYDYVRGDVSFSSSTIGDFSIAKSPDTVLYNFAVVVDDHEMAVSHVVRGEDHIPNTPRQVLLQKALGFSVPRFVHIPLILGPDKSKLSKRHGATSVTEYKEMGYLPNAMFNFLSILGWRPKDDEKEIMSKDQIIKEFSVDGIHQAGAIFDIEKLNWMNGLYIRNLEEEDFVKMCKPFLPKSADSEYTKRVVSLEKDRVKKISDIKEATEYFFKTPEYDFSLLVWKKMTVDELKETLLNLYDIIDDIEEKSWTKEGIEGIIMPQAEIAGDRGRMLWPLRVALSGRKASPGPFEIMDVLGKEESLKRVKEAANKLSNE